MSIELEVLSYSSGDIDYVREWIPRSADEVYIQLTIEVGEVGLRGGTLFQMIVATPEGIEAFKAQYPKENPYVKGLLVVKEYSWQAVVNEIDNVLRKCSRLTWDDSIECLRKRFLWEYERGKRRR